MGFTPELVTGVWVGGDERYIHFNTMALGQGARAALPVYGLYMKKVYADPKLKYKQGVKFDVPEGVNVCGGGEFYGHVESDESFEAVEGIFE